MSSPPGGWLNAEQQRAWLAFMRLQLRMTYEMNRQLQADSAMSFADYHVLNALAGASGGTMSVTALAAQIGWERSRASHHAKRMAARGLVEMTLAARDRRVTEVSLTAAGRDVLSGAAPGHVELVRRLFFDGLDPEVVQRLAESLETVYENVLDRGSLGRPPIG
ncbi:MarR family winged helix-turn-helix transcriptional regulator [Dactylosporangium sp. CA-092794]|uniref:MarR family winged helix-turn-helix transcriptional regulator n=1 Tax=Dactylosporangium sp. CA-092794 TaxID=3239929 RepID=UPI003D929F5E